MYRIKLTSQAKRELKNLKTIHKEALGEILEEIKENPLIGKQLTRELTGRLSYKVSVYRIIYITNDKDKIITVLTIGNRSRIYK